MRAPADVPPTMLSGEFRICTPSKSLPSLAVPLTSVPIKFPCTRFPEALTAWTTEPSVLATDTLPDMGVKLVSTVTAASTDAEKIDLLSRHSFFLVLINEFGFISSVHTSNSIHKTPQVVADDIAEIRLDS